jgi:hypothetical protein
LEFRDCPALLSICQQFKSGTEDVKVPFFQTPAKQFEVIVKSDLLKMEIVNSDSYGQKARLQSLVAAFGHHYNCEPKVVIRVPGICKDYKINRNEFKTPIYVLARTKKFVNLRHRKFSVTIFFNNFLYL